MIEIYFAAHADRWKDYEKPLCRALDLTGFDYHLSPECDDPAAVDYIVHAPNGPLSDFTPFTRTKAVLSLWAGVETIIDNETLTQPLARMVDNDLTRGMVEWVTGHVMRHHLGMDAHICGQNGVWAPRVPPLARDRTVAILGLGALGQACAYILSELGFEIHGWSRTAKDLRAITCHSGEIGLKETLALAEILVLLLPLTRETENLINGKRLALMPRGGVILNPGRGALIDDVALLSALKSGQIGHATLDVFREEPLPPDHPYWANPGVTVTPHIASETRPDSASRVIVENIRRGEAGAPFMNLVDRAAGY